MSTALIRRFSTDPRSDRSRQGAYNRFFRSERSSGGSIDPLSVADRRDIIFLLCCVTLACSLSLGGGTRSGFMGDAILQLVAVPLLVAAVLRMRSAEGFPRGALLVWSAILFVPLVQLIPVPPDVWRRLAIAGPRLEALETIRRTPDWAPLTLIPEQTILAALGLIAPIAVFFGVISMNAPQRRALVVLVLAFALASVFLGVAQIAGGRGNPFYFYAVTNPTEAVGFFANRNHFSASLFVSLLLASAWAIDAGLTFIGRDPTRELELGPVLAFAASVTLIFLLASMQVMTRSRAGLALTGVAIIIVGLFAVTDPRNKWRAQSLLALVLVTALALAFAAHMGLSRLLERFQPGASGNTRLEIAERTIEIARQYLPTGTGLATFSSIYPLYEKPQELLADTFVNHAHNDLLELTMEAGVPGLIALCAALVWLVARGVNLYRSAGEPANTVDIVLPRVALASCFLLLLHSLVDFPLHTSADFVLMSCCAALSVPPKRAIPAPPVPSQDFLYISGRDSLRQVRRVEQFDVVKRPHA